jgi:hypothetical protein
MGQYYKPISLDSREYLSAHEYDNGLKLMEHSWINNHFVDTVESLLMEGGKWYMDRIVWAGDYGDDDLFLDEFRGHSGDDLVGAYLSNVSSPDSKENLNLYIYADMYFTCIRPDYTNVRPRFLINHTKLQYVDKDKCPVMRDGYRVHPLPLLTSSGNGRGGGDYDGNNMEYVGIWAGDSISVGFTCPQDYTEIVPNFEE